VPDINTGAIIISQLFSKCWLVCFLQLSFLLAQTYSYTTDVNQSLKNRTRFTSYMHASYADLLRESVSYRKAATGLQCGGVHQKHVNIKSAFIMPSAITFSQLQYCLEKADCRSCTCGIGIFKCALAGKFYEHMEASMQSRSQERH